MRPDRFRIFTKRGAALGLLSVVAATVVFVTAGIVIAAVVAMVF